MQKSHSGNHPDSRQSIFMKEMRVTKHVEISLLLLQPGSQEQGLLGQFSYHNHDIQQKLQNVIVPVTSYSICGIEAAFQQGKSPISAGNRQTDSCQSCGLICHGALVQTWNWCRKVCGSCSIPLRRFVNPGDACQLTACSWESQAEAKGSTCGGRFVHAPSSCHHI